MLRLRSLSIAAWVGVASVIATLAGGDRLRAQPAPPAPLTGLRSTIDDGADEPPIRRRPAKPKPRRDEPPPGRTRTYGNPPGFGAGKTGFVSTNTPPRWTGLPAMPGAPQRAPTATSGALGAASAASPSGAVAGAGDGTVGAAAATGANGALPRPATDMVATAVSVRPLPSEGDPFDALGIRAGTFVLRPAIEIWGGYNTNPTSEPGGPRSSFATVAPELLARSDWQRHEVSVSILGSYTGYESTPMVDRPNLNAKVDGRIDVTRDTRIDLEGRYLLTTDYPGSPNLPAGLAKLPIDSTVGATIGVGQRFNRFDFSLKGTVDRSIWQESLLTDGTTSSNADRNYNQYGAQLRGGYALTPGLKPFVQVDVDSRIHDLLVDRTGLERDSNGIAAKVGTTLDISRFLTGEIATGYLNRTYKDPTLPDAGGVIVDGSLLWSATALTNVKLTATTTVQEATVAGVSGELSRNCLFQIDHSFRRWLIGTVKLGYELDDYVGSSRIDHRYLASVGIVYKLSRTVQIKGEVRQEWLRSTVSGADYTATIAQVGLRLQR